MKKRTLFIISLILTLCIIGWNSRLEIFEYFQSKHTINWSKDGTITIKDYEGEIDETSDKNLYYYHGFYLNSNDVESANVKAFFDKDKSWIKDSTHVNLNEDLKMEKLIFDLYECYVRKFNHEIDLIRSDKSKTIEDLEKIGNSLHNELKKDIAKIHNTDLPNAAQYNIWRPKIDNMLLDTEQLKNAINKTEVK